MDKRWLIIHGLRRMRVCGWKQWLMFQPKATGSDVECLKTLKNVHALHWSHGRVSQSVRTKMRSPPRPHRDNEEIYENMQIILCLESNCSRDSSPKNDLLTLMYHFYDTLFSFWSFTFIILRSGWKNSPFIFYRREKNIHRNYLKHSNSPHLLLNWHKNTMLLCVIVWPFLYILSPAAVWIYIIKP